MATCSYVGQPPVHSALYTAQVVLPTLNDGPNLEEFLGCRLHLQYSAHTAAVPSPQSLHRVYVCLSGLRVRVTVRVTVGVRQKCRYAR